MMPENLLNELEQTAKDAGVRVALIAAYQAGQCCELSASVDSLRNEAAQQKFRMEMGVQMGQPAPKSMPLAYNADWVSQEGD